MKTILLTTFCFSILAVTLAQDVEALNAQGIEKAQAGAFEEALMIFSRSIEMQPENYKSWYFRGLTNSKLRRYEAALEDFVQTIGLAPDLQAAYFQRGLVKETLTNYEGAMTDYTLAIKLDPDYTDAYYYRGLLADKLGQRDAACTDFFKAQALGMEDINRKIDRCKDTTKSAFPIHSILWLEKTAKNKTYGFTEKNPVMVGTGTEGGPANQRAYLDLLRDERGQSITYERLGSCCPYESEHGYIGGMGMLDQYEITYLNDKGMEEKAVVYISFYDYEEPLILHGFNTVKAPR